MLALMLAVFGWALAWLCLVKLVDMVAFNMVWCVRRGDAYRRDLEAATAPDAPGKFTVDVVARLNGSHHRNHLRMSRLIRRLPGVGRALALAYHFPVLFGATAVALMLAAIRQQDKWLVGALVVVLLAAALVILGTRYTNRLILARFGDLDDSLFLPTRTEADALDSRLVETPAFRKAVLLFLLDVTLFTFMFGAIYAGIDCLSPGAFNKARLTPVDYWYFAVVTTSTTGFGDILPGSTAARALVSLQILVAFAHLVGFVLVLSLTTRVEPFRR